MNSLLTGAKRPQSGAKRPGGETSCEGAKRPGGETGVVGGCSGQLTEDRIHDVPNESNS